MSTLYIRPPSKAAADAVPHWIALPVPYALADGEGAALAILREGQAPLAELADGIARARRVVLLLAAADVTLLRAQVPPLSGARLRAALPNLLEDQLMGEAAEAVFVPGAAHEGLRSVAVAQRGWLEILLHTLLSYGAREVAALPAQLCLPLDGGATASLQQADGGAELAIRSGAEQGFGLTLADTDAAAAIATLAAMVPTAPVTLFVAPAQVRACQEAASAAMGLDQRITVLAENWPRWIAGARAKEAAAFDLFSVMEGAGRQGFDWQPWRWPLALAALLILVNAAALNIDWLRKKREAEGLRAQMVQAYRAAFPRETVVVDPLAQMKQKVAAAQREAGQAAPDDFGALTANFAAALEAVSAGRPAASLIAGLDYRERALFIKPRAGAQLPVDALKGALAARGLSLAPAPNNSWQVRSAP